MNDGMCKARLAFLGNQFKKDYLFDCTPEEEVPDTEQLKKDLLEYLGVDERLPRKELRLRALGRHFCKFMKKDIDSAIGELLKSGRLFSSNGKSRINDAVVLSATPFGSPGSKLVVSSPAPEHSH